MTLFALTRHIVLHRPSLTPHVRYPNIPESYYIVQLCAQLNKAKGVAALQTPSPVAQVWQTSIESVATLRSCNYSAIPLADCIHPVLQDQAASLGHTPSAFSWQAVSARIFKACKPQPRSGLEDELNPGAFLLSMSSEWLWACESSCEEYPVGVDDLCGTGVIKEHLLYQCECPGTLLTSPYTIRLLSDLLAGPLLL